MTLGGVGGAGTSIYGSRNVLSGLASGMDTESMIENMTKATRLKIAQQKQKKELLGWKQQAYQSVSTPLIEFSRKYMDYQSPTNLLSSAFFDQSIITSVGKNNGLVSATGKTTSDVKINGVHQLASSANDHGIGSALANASIETGEIGMDQDITVHDLAGEGLTFKYGNKRYSVSLPQGADIDNVDKLAEEINKKLAETSIDGGGKLSDKVKVTAKADGTGSDKKLVFENIDKSGNKLELAGASEKMQSILGVDFEKVDEAISITKKNPYTTPVIKDTDLTHKENMADFLVGKNLTFSVNGKEKNITLLTETEKSTLTGTAAEKNEKFKKLLQDKLDGAFGTGKVQVDFSVTPGKDTGKLSFTTKDKNDILRVTGGSGKLFGDTGALGIEAGDGNRLNMNRSLEKLGITFPSGTDKKELTINGIKVGEYDKEAKISDIIKDINNNEELGISVKYSEISNEFVFTTKETGENTKIEITGGLGEELFGKVEAQGTDAIIDVTVNGKHEQLKRSSNDIDIDGLKVKVSGKFGNYDTNGTLSIDPAEEVSFTFKPDTEKVFDAIKEMVEDYNKIIDTLHTAISTKPSREYQPLTDEQKKEMSKEEIEKWEEKAQEGLLFGDSHLRELQNDLRFIFAPGGEAGAALRAMGIEPADNYKSGSKIKLDETKLKAALEANPEKVKEAFNAPSPAGAQNSGDRDAFKGGVMTQLKSISDKFASTSLSRPGILLQRAGSPKSANSMMNNALQKEIDGIDKTLDGLNLRLKKEIDRYNSKFTQLEMLVSQMNAQSGQLAGLMGGGMM